MRVYRVEWRGGAVERHRADTFLSLVMRLVDEQRINNVIRIDQGLMPL